MDAPLQPAHLQFLKKLKESPQKRSFASALFSPFDKYTPPYNTSSDVQNLKKRESVTSSYLSSIDMPAYKRPALKTSQTPKKSVTFAQQLEVIVECPRSYPGDSPRRTQTQPTPPVEIPKPLPALPETTAAIDVTLDTTPSDIDMELPAPLSPVTNISDDLIQASFAGSGEKVELTSLRNVAMEIEELDHPSVIEYHPESTVSSVANGLSELAPAKKLPTCEDITMIDANEMIQKDTPMVTDEVRSLSNDNASELTTIEQITKEFEIEPQNADAISSSESTSVEVNATETTEASTVADENETEILPVDKPPTVSTTEQTATSDSAATKQDSTPAPTPVVPTTDVDVTEIVHLSPPVIPPAAEIAQSPTNEGSICEVSKEPSSNSGPSVLKQPSSSESSSTNSTEATREKVPTSNQVTSTTVSSSSASTISASKSEAPVVSTVSSTTSETTILPSIIEKSVDSDNSAPSTSTHSTSQLKSATASEEMILSDSTVFTPLDAKQVSHISTEPNSQIFAIKVKGTENQTQLSQLVDLCKKNPLFKNKNVKFKIVPVKGPITKTLQEHAQRSGNVLNKAIIVQKSNCNAVQAEKAATSPKTVKIVSPANRRYNKISPVEKVTGPWECSSCLEASSKLPLKLNSYHEYRTHLHEKHNEPNNSVFCIYCGYKSLKRNQQLYHLLSKHQVQPPANIQFPKCDKCDFFALNEYNLQKHLGTHQTSGMEYVCSCREAFKSSDLLQQHMASNVCKNNRSFSCGYCNSQFGRVVNLKAHMRICMKERAKVTTVSAPVIEAIRPSENEPEMILP